MESVHAIELKGITKRFGNNTANDSIDLYVDNGVIMALLGENGSGKTTLMNMLAGIYAPDEGEIYVNGKKVSITSPKVAFDNHIGMIHQHFMLVDVFTAAENIVLGLEEKGRLDMKAASAKIKIISAKYGFDIDPDKKIYDMSVSEKQTVEIIKVLYRGADILILDEPTAVLTPQEIERLFAVIRAMRDDGKVIIIITHKLNEVMAVSDVVAVLRKGKHIKTVRTSETTPSELTELMVGRKVELNIDRKLPADPQPRLTIAGLTVKDGEGVKKLDDVGFIAFGGEILGIAGIAGSGQKELLEAVAGLRKAETGSIIYSPEGKAPSELVGKTPMEIRDAGV
ncbi:MAG: ATP-binding cassette domain-containing protein, partial [Firmicutes bacterium]|nr:ATP-binding cassette domain-containing protein [Bacillota bacterium]